jgi:SAM-dependent methyltransferase
LDLNPKMLVVARSVTSGTRPEIDWRAGNAAELPFGEETFDVVLCQCGLQYVPDRFGALREMVRVLKPGGRLLLSVPRPLQTHPAHLALADALEQYAGPEVAAIINTPFALGKAEEIRSLVTGAGFQQIHIRIEIDTMRFPSAEEFVRRQVMGSPLAGPVSQISDDAQSNVIAHVATVLRSYIDDDGLATPMETHFVVAMKATPKK